jgi:hypothetical protein
MAKETGGASGSLRALLADSEGVVRLGNGEAGQNLAKKPSRLCLSLKDRESVTIGDDIRVTVYRHTGRIRLIIESPRKYAILRHAK